MMTKKIRNKIYKQALKQAQFYMNDSLYSLGICRWIWEALIELDSLKQNQVISNKIDPYLALHKYPEIYKHKPLGCKSGSSWFEPTREGADTRIEILNQAIKETE